MNGKTPIRIDSPKTTLKGTTAGKADYVEYRIGTNGRFRKARGGADWKVIARLKHGRNLVFLRAVNSDSGLTSSLRRVIIVRF